MIFVHRFYPLDFVLQPKFIWVEICSSTYWQYQSSKWQQQSRYTISKFNKHPNPNSTSSSSVWFLQELLWSHQFYKTPDWSNPFVPSRDKAKNIYLHCRKLITCIFWRFTLFNNKPKLPRLGNSYITDSVMARSWTYQPLQSRLGGLVAIIHIILYVFVHHN